jgi:hypothetical protein
MNEKEDGQKPSEDMDRAILDAAKEEFDIEMEWEEKVKKWARTKSGKQVKPMGGKPHILPVYYRQKKADDDE